MSNLPAKSENVQKIGAELARSQEKFSDLLPKNIPTQKFVAIVKAAMNNNPELLECTPRSVVTACEKAASDGLMLDGREAALVIYNKREKQGSEWVTVAREAQYIPMVAGMRRRIYNSGLVSSLESGIVYKGELENGDFEYVTGTDPRLVHKPMLIGELGDPVAVYSVVTMASGHKSVEVMRWSEVMRIAALQSKNVAKYDDKKKNIRAGDLVGIWAQHTMEMARKTVLRRHSKQLPFDSNTAAMFERVDDLYRSPDEPFDPDAPQDDEAAPPASAGKKAGGGKAALDKARQERASAEAATSSQTSAPERAEDVEDLEPVRGEDSHEQEDDRI